MVLHLIRALRPDQWTKNLVLFAGLIFAGGLGSARLVLHATSGFLVFCALSGATYIFNDLADIRSDREHPVKRNRPLASGNLSMGVAAVTLLYRAVCLQVLDKEFLLHQGEARHLRVVSLPAHRGMIQDRNGDPLAISTPVESVWINPQELGGEQQRIPELAKLLSMDRNKVQRLLASRADREFVYLQRHISPALATQVKDLRIPGVYLQREYRRYYPAAEVSAHVVGMTNIDDVGLEGLELAYEDWLAAFEGRVEMPKEFVVPGDSPAGPSV